MSSASFTAIWLTALLATVTTVLLLVLSTPLSWWLARTRSRAKPVIEALTTLPLVLPPTVLGFYLLIAFNPDSPIGGFFVWMTGESIAFTFQGLVIASLIYSLPFMVQPLRVAFEEVDNEHLETAEVMGANKFTRFFQIVVPLSIRGYLTGAALTFAHTVGEFGVVLMIGGNIPGKTRVVSVAIYESVESLDYTTAHMLSLILVIFSLTVLIAVYSWIKRPLHGVVER